MLPLRSAWAALVRFVLLAGVLVALPRLAHAADPASLAVLPLEKGAGSAQYDGLGRALAGMLVTDLTAVPGLKLVERDQLDSLLAEMKLKDSGFLDPKTAQKLGKGLGARYVVVGSYTVIEPKFLLDARIVEVQSGEIVKAQDASGSVDDFVSVEKDLVEKLVANLDLSLSSAERRKLLASVPTEKFSAFKDYGEGLARQSEGKDDEAKAAFSRAVATDPAFEEARRALDELTAVIAAVKAERQAATAVVTDAARAKLLADVPDERTRAATYADTQDDLLRFTARMHVLGAERRPCDQYAEMEHFLTRKQWKVGQLAQPPMVLGMTIYAELRARKFTDADIDRMSPMLLERVEDFLATMVRAADACLPPAKAVKAADDVRKAVTSRGLDAQKAVVGAPLGERLEVLWATIVAGRLGATDELTRRTKALLTSNTSPEMEATVGRILRAAADTQARRGVDFVEAARRVEAVAAGKLAATKVCAAAKAQQKAAAAWLGDYQGGRWGYTGMVAEDLSRTSIPLWAPASDFGCLADVAPRFPNADAALTFFAAAPGKKDTGGDDPDACRAIWQDFDAAHARAKASRDLADLFATDTAWSDLVAAHCAHE